jgi:phosphoglycolate phosphatase
MLHSPRPQPKRSSEAPASQARRQIPRAEANLTTDQALHHVPDPTGTTDVETSAAPQRTLTFSQVILFDWRATLADTLDSMYHAVDDLLPELEQLGLLARLVDPRHSRSPDDAKLIEYVRDFGRLHPKIGFSNQTRTNKYL